jgi:C4-type Zn-finger protein
MRCPRCSSKDVRRSRRRNLLERIASVLIKPYRCDNCDYRFFSRGPAGESGGSSRNHKEAREQS